MPFGGDIRRRPVVSTVLQVIQRRVLTVILLWRGIVVEVRRIHRIVGNADVDDLGRPCFAPLSVEAQRPDARVSSSQRRNGPLFAPPVWEPARAKRPVQRK